MKRTISTVWGLDAAARQLARFASTLSRVRGAGVFWVGGGAPYWAAWREPGAWTLRLGRLELILDLAN